MKTKFLYWISDTLESIAKNLHHMADWANEKSGIYFWRALDSKNLPNEIVEEEVQ